MKPVTVATTIRQPREDVFAFLDVAANHEAFNDHFLREWRFSGPAAGVGARTSAVATAAGRSEEVEIEVVEADEPARLVERNVGAKGRRVGIGTYELADVSAGVTEVTFTYAWQTAPVAERLAAPVVRRVMRRLLTESMLRLEGLLTAADAVPAAKGSR